MMLLIQNFFLNRFLFGEKNDESQKWMTRTGRVFTPKKMDAGKSRPKPPWILLGTWKKLP